MGQNKFIGDDERVVTGHEWTSMVFPLDTVMGGITHVSFLHRWAPATAALLGQGTHRQCDNRVHAKWEAGFEGFRSQGYTDHDFLATSDICLQKAILELSRRYHTAVWFLESTRAAGECPPS